MGNLKDSVVNKFLFIQISIHGFIKYSQVAFYWKNFSKQFLKKKKNFCDRALSISLEHGSWLYPNDNAEFDSEIACIMFLHDYLFVY